MKSKHTGYYFVAGPARFAPNGAPAAPTCVSCQGVHKSLDRRFALCLAQAAASDGGAGGYFHRPDDHVRGLTRLELAALPAIRGEVGRPRTARGADGRVVATRVSTSEYADVAERAKALGQSVSDYLRAALGLPEAPAASRGSLKEKFPARLKK